MTQARCDPAALLRVSAWRRPSARRRASTGSRAPARRRVLRGATRRRLVLEQLIAPGTSPGAPRSLLRRSQRLERALARVRTRRRPTPRSSRRKVPPAKKVGVLAAGRVDLRGLRGERRPRGDRTRGRRARTHLLWAGGKDHRGNDRPESVAGSGRGPASSMNAGRARRSARPCPTTRQSAQAAAAGSAFPKDPDRCKTKCKPFPDQARGFHRPERQSVASAAARRIT